MTTHPVKRRKKLIEIAIPLEAINAASAREKSIRHGHPSTLHLWWARRPLAAARAVIFCQMVDDPSAVPEEFSTEEEQENERLRLFALISELVTWENTTNEQVLNRAREEIKRSWRRACADNAEHPEAAELFNPEKLPGFHDPFAGGGALPLEAQRLGLESYASDLNPVAVLINKGMIEIPQRFSSTPVVNPEASNSGNLLETPWKASEGLAQDLEYYAKTIANRMRQKLNSCYPFIAPSKEDLEIQDIQQKDGVGSLPVVAWLWARTVKSPNPAFGDVEVPLVNSFVLRKKVSRELVVRPIINGSSYHFKIDKPTPDELETLSKGTKATGRSSGFYCIMSGDLISFKYIREQAKAGKMTQRLMAVVAKGKSGRIYASPSDNQQKIALNSQPEWQPETPLPEKALGFRVQEYGMTYWSQLFTNRQLLALASLTEEIRNICPEIEEDSRRSLLKRAGSVVSEQFHKDYAGAIQLYLSFCVSKVLDLANTIVTWRSDRESSYHLFSRHAIPMSWDFCELNPLLDGTGTFTGAAKWTAESIRGLGHSEAAPLGCSIQADAQEQDLSRNKIISTDPPYFDNIGYADLSDFFYIWLRRCLSVQYPTLVGTVLVPKGSELIASKFRHPGKGKAESFFLDGMTKAIRQLASKAHEGFPLTIYYAFKQSETKGSAGTSSTGWEAFLAAVVEAGLAIVGTWPIRTELSNRMIGSGTNALASSVVLACQRRDQNASILSRTDFRRELRKKLPEAIRELEHANIAPVDVAQAAIGPGMAIYSQAKAVLNPDDSPMSVREALIEINTALDEHLAEDDSSFDADTRFALTFFESYGYSERPYGDAESLAIARNISVEGVTRAGILSAIAGKVQLLRREQLDDDWDPSRDERLCVWEATQHLIKALETGGEAAAAALMVQLKQLPGQSDLLANCRALAYRLYNHCEKTKQAEEGRAYNGLVIAWQEIERQASNQPTETAVQVSLI